MQLAACRQQALPARPPTAAPFRLRRLRVSASSEVSTSEVSAKQEASWRDGAAPGGLVVARGVIIGPGRNP
jgi:hypothetical protein